MVASVWEPLTMSMGSLEVVAATVASTALSAPAVRGWLRRREYLDHPNKRSSHVVPTPRGGGLACAVGGAVGSVTAYGVGQRPSGGWMGASALLGLVGRTDDLVGLSATLRLGAQAVCGALVGVKAGGLPGAAIGTAVFPAVVNAFNFMDGINGISGGTSASWGLCIGTDSLLAKNVRAQGFISAGMGLGFLPFNVPAASMFLGDVGSYLIGAGIAVSVIESAFVGGRLSVTTSVRSAAPLIPYFADTGNTIVRRVVRGESVTEPHREHAYQRLVQECGWEHWKVSLLVASAGAACGLVSRSSLGTLAIVPIVGAYLAAPDLVRTVRASGRWSRIKT